MTRIFKRLSLPLKLGLIGLLPVLFIVYLAMSVQSEKNEKLVILDSFREQVKQSSLVNSLIDQLQAERRYSFGYVINQVGESRLEVQRSRTDQVFRSIAPQRGSRLENFQTFTFYDQMADFRTRIDAGEVTAPQVMSFYTNVIFRLNTLAPVFTGTVTYLNPVVPDLRGQRNLSEMITYLGIIRGTVYLNLYTAQDSIAAGEQIRGIWDIYKSYEKEFYQKASPTAVNAYNRILNDSNLKATVDYVERRIAGKSQNVGYSDAQWWDISARGIDQLRMLSNSLLERVQRQVDAIYEREVQARNRNLGFLITAIILLVVVTYFTIKGISDSLNELRLAAEKLALGGSDLTLSAKSNDVVGSLTQSIVAIDVNNKKLAAAAQAIGDGNFDVEVVPRSGQDILGNAVARMKKDLQEFTISNEEKLWLQQGIAEIAKSVRGEKDVPRICNDALSVLVSYAGAQLGLMYVAYNEVLEHTAGYAIPDANALRRQVLFGETLVGQAARNAEMIYLDEVPEEYWKISSTSGNTVPEALVILPLVHNGIVEGVVEIAFMKRPLSKVVALLQESAHGIAIALQAAKSRARLQELLEETQAQSEELQSQHNELENINSELEAQAEKLQASEEELKVQQEELQQANQELEEQTRVLEERNMMILEKNAQIEQKAEELAISSKYKSEFLANMSHELRTPLNSILLLSRLLSENNEANLTQEQIEYAKVIQSSGNGLLTLIDEILDLSKIEAGKMKLEYETVPVKELTTEMRTLFEPIAKEKGLEFRLKTAEGIPELIETDKLRLGQVLKNLLSNAMKFTLQGSVTLEVQHCDDDRRLLCFSVTDTGIGIPQEKQQLIFEAFQQADGSTRRKFGGTGLGLSITREIMRMLGGKVEVSSKTGEGSRFTIYVPIEKGFQVEEQSAGSLQELVADVKQVSEGRPAGSQKYLSLEIPENIPDDRAGIREGDKTILIVEDDTAFAKSLLEYTRKKGYKGVVSVRGDEVLELARQIKPLGILLDIQLPVKSGWQVMDELKKDPQTRSIPVHVMSSHHAKKESLQKGAIDFINKPVAFEQMQEVFRKLETVLSKDPKKVLIVEENPKHAKALSYFLETFQINTEIKKNVQESVKALKGGVDCVILDMGVPDQKAYDMLEEMKHAEGMENLPIIIFTGKSLSLAEEQRIRQNADSIVVKTVHSYQRILDEVSIFLHLVDTPAEQPRNNGHRKVGALAEVLKDKTVLVVDDDVRNIFSLTKALEKMGMKVQTAVDGKEALRKLEEHKAIDIVLLDMMMPELDGYETARRIRENFAWRDLPVIAVTAKAMTGDREKCIAAGASDYITKPVDIDQLLSLLRVWLFEGVK